jgi:hypothetical protein
VASTNHAETADREHCMWAQVALTSLGRLFEPDGPHQTDDDDDAHPHGSYPLAQHQYRNEVPQHHHCDLPSSRAVRHSSVLRHQHGWGCVKFGTKRPQVQILSPVAVPGLELGGQVAHKEERDLGLLRRPGGAGRRSHRRDLADSAERHLMLPTGSKFGGEPDDAHGHFGRGRALVACNVSATGRPKHGAHPPRAR